jgi:Zn-dependent oligopeptidase
MSFQVTGIQRATTATFGQTLLPPMRLRFLKTQGTYYDPAIAKSLYDNIMSVGDTIDPAEGFKKFRGRDVDTKALLRKRGFPVD